MISSTLNQYKESFKTNLLAFLNEYEDNTKSFFLQNEKKKYQAYQKALTKIVDQMMFFTSEELKNNNRVHKSIAADLKEINPQAYKAIITELVQITKNERLSLSTHKRDKIIIDEKELENHIKSSIVILKFISEEFEIPFDLKEKILSDDNEFNLDIIDKDLDIWLKGNEDKIDYSYMPLMIEEKADYVTDSYKNYEERNYKHQIAICNSILVNHKDEKTVIDFKRKFENNLIALRKKYPIPNTSIEAIISNINNAFYRLEKFMEGSVSIYQSFLFSDTFTLFFNELNKIENITVKNHTLRDGYHYFISQLYYAYDKNEFKNEAAYENEDFNRDCNELFYINEYRNSEFGINVDIDDYKFEMPSILDIVNDATNDSFNAFNQKNDIKLETNKASTNINENLSASKINNYKNLRTKFGNSYENLTNDPLLNPENEYIVLNKNLELERISKAIGDSSNGFFVTYTYEPGFEEWEKHQHLEIGKSFLKLVKELNHNKIFFFGCSFDNYKHNYDKRLNDFLDNFYDASESDFVVGELEFLENILYDIQNSEGAHDGYSVSDFSNFSKAFDIITGMGYKQYLFSHNKKEAFLNNKQYSLTQEEKLKESVAIINHKVEIEKPKTFELSKKLKKKLRFINISENEQKELDKLDTVNNIIEIENSSSEKFELKKEKKLSEKWYALLYLLELKATESKPPTNYEGSFIKSEIQEVGKQRTGTTGQSFYREFLKINDIINNNSLLERSFGKDWKQKIIVISNNSEMIISYLKNYI